MRTITFNIYSFDELSDEAKQTAIDNCRDEVSNHEMDCLGDDYVDTLAELANATGFEAKNWDVNACGYHVTAHLKSDIYTDIFNYYGADEICGALLFRYVNREIMPNFWKGKYHSTMGHYDENGKYCYKYRYSRIIQDWCCPLVGMWTEIPFEDKLFDYYNHWNEYPKDYSLQDLMQDCYDAMFEQWSDEYDNSMRDNFVEEEIIANEYEFYENGKQYNNVA